MYGADSCGPEMRAMLLHSHCRRRSGTQEEWRATTMQREARYRDKLLHACRLWFTSGGGERASVHSLATSNRGSGSGCGQWPGLARFQRAGRMELGAAAAADVLFWDVSEERDNALRRRGATTGALCWDS